MCLLPLRLLFAVHSQQAQLLLFIALGWLLLLFCLLLHSHLTSIYECCCISHDSAVVPQLLLVVHKIEGQIAKLAVPEAPRPEPRPRRHSVAVQSVEEEGEPKSPFHRISALLSAGARLTEPQRREILEQYRRGTRKLSKVQRMFLNDSTPGDSTPGDSTPVEGSGGVRMAEQGRHDDGAVNDADAPSSSQRSGSARGAVYLSLPLERAISKRGTKLKARSSEPVPAQEDVDVVVQSQDSDREEADSPLLSPTEGTALLSTKSPRGKSVSFKETGKGRPKRKSSRHPQSVVSEDELEQVARFNVMGRMVHHDVLQRSDRSPLSAEEVKA